MKVLVTGATGFVGSHLVQALVEKELDVRCLVRTTSNVRWLADLPVEYVYGDCCDRQSLTAAVRDVEQVFHLAGVTKAVDARTYHRVNTVGTENLVDACLCERRHVPKLIYVSSQAAAGPSQNDAAKKEADPCCPVSLYGKSKWEAEQVVLAHRRDLPAVILRPCAVYGPRDKDFYLFFKLVSKKIKPVLRGAVRRISLCYVTDVVRAILLASEKQDDGGGVFFVADGDDHCVDDVFDALASAVGTRGYRVPVPKSVLLSLAACSQWAAALTGRAYALGRDKAREIVQANWTCDITRARVDLGFEPCISLAKGAKLTIQWYRQQQWL